MSSSPNSVPLAQRREESANILREIVDRMGINVEVSAFDDGDRVILDAHGPESGLIIGKKGATLDALQWVVNRMMIRREKEAAGFIDAPPPAEKAPGEKGEKEDRGGPSIVVDAEGYRGRREEALVDMANRLADKAQRSGRPTHAEAMSPHDRRIIHVTLADHPGVLTESEGEGADRHVVVIPRKRDE